MSFLLLAASCDKALMSQTKMVRMFSYFKPGRFASLVNAI